MNLKQLIALFSTTLILLSCAQIVPITGGEKDLEAPKEVESTPQNGSINFTEKTITVQFDEFIQLNNVSSQLIVSPLMETPPEILVKGKKLVIKLKDELAANTTYSLNFGNAITDITENNVFLNYKYVFSTGSYLDSLSYSGTVVNAFDLSEKENIYVLLYDQFEDSVPYKELPRYVALSDATGKFSITNIANGRYKLFAINDINGSYLFDLPNEEIAFKNDPIQLDSSSSDHLIYLFEEEGGLQFVDKAENKTYGKVDIILNQPTKSLIINPLNHSFEKKWYVEEKNETGDSLTLWLKTTEEIEELVLELTDEDEVIDTVSINIIPKSEFKDSLLNVTTNITGSFNLDRNIAINTNRPIDKGGLQVGQIKLYEDSIPVKDFIIFSENLLGSPPPRNTLQYTFKENTQYQLFIPPGTFTDIYGLKNDTVKVGFRTKNESDYGIINLKVTPNFSNNYIIQLFKKDKLIKETSSKDVMDAKYDYLLPGNYQLKLIIDTNDDKKWNTGIYLDGLQPEKVIYYEKEIKIRANWDNDIIWTVNE